MPENRLVPYKMFRNGIILKLGFTDKTHGIAAAAMFNNSRAAGENLILSLQLSFDKCYEAFNTFK